MRITPGTRLGPYEIQHAVGAGGMGEVFKARDTRLDRTVAIKILPEAFAADPQFRERFDREARTVSQLDHPHICALHDVGEQDGTAYLVMQFLDGDTLDQRLARGPMPLVDALRVAIDLADALDKAHRAGVIHRDLKPSNIKLTKSGAKLLDFGLAKMSAPLIAGAGATLAPTTPAGLTQQGTILGTLQYMSPEQLEGREADARSDVFAFGAVLYEMLTGTKAFTGKSQASLVSAILKDTPPPASRVQPTIPARVDRVVMTCLEKDPDDRWQSARDLRRELEWLAGPAEADAPSSPATGGWRGAAGRWGPWLIAAAAMALAAVVLTWNVRRPAATPLTSRLVAGLPADAPYDDRVTPGRSLAIAPDGRRIVYASVKTGGGAPQRQLFKRDLDRLTVEPIAGTEGAYQPFFSPDGQSVAFFTIAGELKRVALSGGPSTTLVRGLQNGQWSFGAWRDDDVIVFSAFANLLQVSANGGTPMPLTNLTEGGVTDLWHQYPAIVPSTGDVIFTVYTAAARHRLDIVRWSDKRRSTLLEEAAGAVVTPSGRVLFSRDGTVMAATFNAATGTAGAPTPIPEPVIVDRQGIAQLSVTRDGTLAYVPPDTDAPAPVLGWMSRTGTFTEIAQLPKGADDLTLSPDSRFAVLMTFATSKVSIFDLARQVSTPLNLEGRQVESVSWHPDGKRLTFGGAYLSLFDPDRGVETRLTPIGRPKRFPSWTPDGRQVAYMTFEPANDIYTVSLDQEGKPTAPRPLIASSAVESDPAISPDGRWIAYRIGDRSTGRTDVYLARFPDGTGRIQVTSNGGGAPFWSGKNDELFFTGPPGVVQSVSVNLGDRAQVGAPRTLFPLTEVEALSVSADGQRFLVLKQRPVPRPRQIVVVQNWLGELTRIAH